MPYAVTKAAQLQLVKCLAVTVGPKIRVNTVLPGLLLTEWVYDPLFLINLAPVTQLLPLFDYGVRQIPSLKRNWRHTDMYAGSEILRGTHPITQRGCCAQTRNVLG
jgi:NAD(P)-dependent dehydrogenase (short-subunit alcohol dehydrogenase family)